MWIKKIIVTVSLVSFFLSCKQKTEKIISGREIISTKKVTNLPYYNTPDFTPTWLSENDKPEKLHKIPMFSFTNQLGNKITNNTFEGSIYVANFFFTSCPNICIKLTNNMHKLQEIYKDDDDIKLLSHSVYPSFDTVEVLKDYGERHNVIPQKWHLVTGKKEIIYKMIREAYFADDVFKDTNDESRFVHTENLILIDKKGHIRGVYKGTLPEEVLRIQRHINILKLE